MGLLIVFIGNEKVAASTDKSGDEFLPRVHLSKFQTDRGLDAV